MSGTTFLTSQRNSLKRHPHSGTTLLAAPSTPAYLQAGTPYIYVTNLTVGHNLGYVPVFRYAYEPFGDGIIWPALTDRINQFASNPNNLNQHGPGLIAWADNTNIYLQLFYVNNSLTNTYPVYWVIYQDFAL